MSAFSDIRAALEGQVASISGVPSSANRAWENVSFTPTVGTPWVRMTLIPSEQRPAVLGSDPVLMYTGLFQVDVFEPEGNGPNAADILADAIRAKFAPGDDYTVNSTTVRIRYSERSPGSLDTSWYQVPVTVGFYSYRS